jgi:hypothetical protein
MSGFKFYHIVFSEDLVALYRASKYKVYPAHSMKVHGKMGV